ncbi:glycosyl transferase [Pigmentiphaga litoralis]|jgi:glycosyltransferase involved in cell wall biosynthesis|uniref:glycosyltransferase n=1 Tax=Pigmentiphaga litoralis TaxID=516702 RepID=UPI00167A6504|nr:glycosyltransferase [Pigmentiphaga litoralis]GGX23300.1 glycosyl transferase [Pigmentiphaga litoralis]
MADVLFVAPDLHRGGVGRCVSFIVDEVPRHGFDTSLFLLRGLDHEYQVNNPDVERGMNVGESKPKFAAMLPVALFRLWRTIQRTKPEIVCSHGLLCNAAVAVMRMMSRRPFRTVAFEHNAPSSHYSTTTMKGLKTFLLRTLYPRHDVVIGVSRGVVDDLVTLVPDLQGKCSHIYNGLPVEEVSRQSQEAPPPQADDAKFSVVSVGRLAPSKDYKTLVAAAQILDDPDVQFLVIGEGPLEEELRVLNEASPSRSRVKFLGHLDNPFPAVAAADIFLLTSVHESFGIVLVEALSLGVPVLATNCPSGPAEILSDGEFGVLVPVSNAAAIAEAIRRLLYEREPAKRLRSLGPLRANDFSLNQHAQRVVDLFRTLIADRKQPRGV